MLRKARIDAPGTLHHIIVMGIERRKIFYDDKLPSNASKHPITGIVRRHHLYAGNIQRQIKKAGIDAGIPKRITAHTLRHGFAAHLLENSYDIRRIQELPGHSSLQTTMIYTHVAGKNRLGVTSPLD